MRRRRRQAAAIEPTVAQQSAHMIGRQARGDLPTAVERVDRLGQGDHPLASSAIVKDRSRDELQLRVRDSGLARVSATFARSLHAQLRASLRQERMSALNRQIQELRCALHYWASTAVSRLSNLMRGIHDDFHTDCVHGDSAFNWRAQMTGRHRRRRFWPQAQRAHPHPARWASGGSPNPPRYQTLRSYRPSVAR